MDVVWGLKAGLRRYSNTLIMIKDQWSKIRGNTSIVAGDSVGREWQGLNFFCQKALHITTTTIIEINNQSEMRRQWCLELTDNKFMLSRRMGVLHEFFKSLKKMHPYGLELVPAIDTYNLKLYIQKVDNMLNFSILHRDEQENSKGINLSFKWL